MPSVPSYQRQVAPQVSQAPRALNGGGDLNGLAQGVNNVTNVLTKIVQDEQDKADHAALLDADNQLTQWQNDAFYNQENGIYTKKGKNAFGVAGQTIQSFDEFQQQIGANLTTDRQRQKFAEMVMNRKNQMTVDLDRYEYAEQQRYKNDVDQSAIALSQDSAALNFSDPSKVGMYRDKALAVVQAQAERLGWSPEETQLQMLGTSSKLLTGVIGRMAEQNPHAAKQYLEQSRSGITADDQLRIGNAIDREIKQREIEARQMQAIARAELSTRVADASSAYMAGFDYANPPSRAEFVAAHGAEKGNEAYAQFQKLQGVGLSMRELATASPEEASQILSRYQPAPGGVASEGFRQDAHVYGSLLNSANRLMKARQDDPASYVAQYSPQVQQAFAVAQQAGTPEAYQAYAQASLAEQQRLGVQNPKLLPDAQADQIIAQFGEVSDGGNNSSKLIQNLQAQWGSNWPQVYSQLQKKLPGAALVIGSGVDAATSNTLARIAPLKTDQLRDGLDSGDLKDAKENLNERMSDFRATLSHQVGGERTFSTMYEQAERLAYTYMGQGMKAKDAVEKAIAPLVDDKYTLKGTYRVPKSLDADTIDHGANVAKQELNLDEVQFNIPKGLDPQFAKERVKGALDREGYWVTTPDEKGLALYFGGEAVLDKSGKPITRSFEDLAGQAAKNPTTIQRLMKGFQPIPRAEQAPAAPQPYMPWLNQ